MAYYVVILFLAVLKVSVGQNGYIYPPPDEVWPGTESVYFGLMMSFGGSQKSSGVVPGVEVALDLINNKSKSSILPRHTLHYILYDSQCNRTTALDGFFSFLVHGSLNPVMALIGSGCSRATLATAEIAHYYNITQISCTSSVHELSDRSRFKNYFQLLPSQKVLAKVFFSIILKYEWRRLAFIVQNDQEYKYIMDEVERLLSKDESSREYTIATHKKRIDNSAVGDKPFESGYRINVLLVSAKLARQLICKAYLLGMKYPRYLFLTYGNSYGPDWWVPPDNEDVNHECTPEDRVKVLQYSLLANYFQFHHHRAMDEHITSKKYLQLYSNRLNTSPFNLSSDSYSQFCFDAAWTLALALNTTLNDMTNSTSTLDLKKQINLTEFWGISGDVIFDSSGIREPMELSVAQYRINIVGVSSSLRLESAEIASIRCNKTDTCTFVYSNGQSDKTVWTEYGKPYDGSPLMEIVTVHPAISAIFVPISVFGVLLSAAYVVVIAVYRERKIIRLTSPNLNYLIGIGSILVFISCAVLFIQPTTNPSAAGPLCMVQMSTLTLGYTLAFGSVLARMIRIYLIFRCARKITIKDWQLIVSVVAITVISALIIIVYVIYEGVANKYEALIEPSVEKMSSVNGVLEKETQYFIYTCTIEKQTRVAVVMVLFAYTSMFQIASLIFAFLTRKVPVTALNESKHIAVAVYVISIALIIIAITTLTIRNYVNLFPLIYGSSILIGAMVLVNMLLLPKIISLFKNPDSEGIFSKRETGPINSAINNTSGVRTHEVEELKKKLEQMDRELAKFKEAEGSRDDITRVNHEILHPL